MTGEWSIRVNENPGIVDFKLSPHCYFWKDFDDDYASIDPYFSSRHTINVNTDDPYRAYIRLTNILRILSAIRVLGRGNAIYTDSNLFYSINNRFTSISYRIDLDVFLEELTHPFDQQVVTDIRNKPIGFQVLSGELDIFGQIFEESVSNEDAREILLWLSFGEKNQSNDEPNEQSK